MSSQSVAMVEILEAIASHPGAEAQWLDLLSQLEYVGCRKILKAVPYDRVGVEVLRHIAEEASHAYLLKSLVEKKGKKGGTWGKASGGLGPVGWQYFQALDERVSRLQQDACAHYPAVSWIVERRVLQIYPLYAGVTRDLGVRRILNQILAQEKRHGDLFAAEPFPPWLQEKAIEIEHELWEQFEAALGEWVQSFAPRLSEAGASAVVPMILEPIQP